MAKVTLLAVLGLLALGCSDTAAPTQCVSYDHQATGTEPTYVSVSGISEGDMLFHTCGGVVLGPKTVLTAGHCIFKLDTIKVTTRDGQKARASYTEVYDWQKSESVSQQPGTHDIGLVRLSESLKLDTYGVVTDYDATGESVTAWTRMTGEARKSETTLFSPEVYSVRDSEKQIVFHNTYLTNRYAQGGDSGSPLFLSGTHVVVGITSSVNGCTGFAARTDVLSDWINGRVNAWTE